MQTRSNYRHDLDYLRTIAVLSVLIFHLNPNWLPGGYLGVDIFFVVSGFIITRNELIRIEVGTFSLPDFYKRRFRRLFPALFLTISLTALASIFIFDSQLAWDAIKSAWFAILGISNFHFFFESGYFDTSSNLKPLLHTWSLGVEEQFYLIWPALLLIMTGHLNIKNTLIIVVSLLCVSLIHSEIASSENPTYAFFILTSRFYEFLIGAALAFLLNSDNQPFLFGLSNRTRARQLIVLICTIALVGSFLYFDEQSSMPGLNAFFPTVLTGIFIWFSYNVFENPGYLHRPFAFISQISYSLYLVHWPIIVFMNYQFSQTDTYILIFTNLILSFICATFLHRYVEVYFRNPSQRAMWLFPTIGSFTLLIGIVLTYIALGPNQAERNIVERTTFDGSIRCNLDRKKSKFCSSEVLLVGDSHAAMYRVGFENFAEKWGLTIETSTFAGCPPVFEAVKIYNAKGWEKQQSQCSQAIEFWERELINTKAQFVVLSARWEQFLSPSKSGGISIRQDYLIPRNSNGKHSLESSRRSFKLLFEKTVIRLIQSGKKIVILGQLPLQKINSINCGRKIDAQHEGDFLKCNLTSEQNFLERNSWIEQYFKDLEERLEGVLFISPSSYLCSQSIGCTISHGNKLIYSNNNHVNSYGGNLIIEEFTTKISEFLRLRIR